MNATEKWRKVTLILNDPNADQDYYIADLETFLDSDEIIPAIMAAAQDFLETEKGREIWEDTCHNFNYGDFLANVTNEFCEPHGFRIIEEDTDIIYDDWNVQLASLDKDDDIDDDNLDSYDDEYDG